MLDDQFSIAQLEDAVQHGLLRQFRRSKQSEWEPILKGVMALARNIEL